MAQSQHGVWMGEQSFRDSSTTYFNFDYIVNESTEANIECPVREAGTFSKFAVYSNRSTLPSVTTTITVRKSRADTSMAVSFAYSESGLKEDTTNTATFAATDEIDIKVVIPNESGTYYRYLTQAHITFTPTSTGNTASILSIGPATVSFASSTRYQHVKGYGTLATTEAYSKYNVGGSFTWKNLYIYVSSNSRTNNTTWKSRKNGADGTLTVTYGNLETGVKEDTSHTDSLSSGDDINLSVTTDTGTNSLVAAVVSTLLISTSSEWLVCGSGLGLTQNYGLTRYNGLMTHCLTAATSENDVRMLPRFNHSLKNLEAYARSNSVNGTSTLTLRDNGADSVLAVSWGSSESGWKSDSDSVDITGGTDYVNYKLVTGGTSGLLAIDGVSMLGYISSGRTGSASITLDASTLSSAGTVKIAGAFSQALADIALSSTSGKVLVQGVLSSLLADILLESAASQLSPISGVLSVTLGDAVLASAGAVALKGTSSLLLDPFGQSFAGKVLVRGNSGITLADLTPSSAGKVLVSGLGPIQLGDLILAGGAAGKVLVSGNAAVALQDLLTSTAGKVLVAGAASIPLADLLMLASGGSPPDIDEIILLLNGRICKKITDTIYIML